MPHHGSMTTTIHFFAPTDSFPASQMAYVEDRRDHRVTLDHWDEVTRTWRATFADGYRLIVSEIDIVSREA